MVTDRLYRMLNELLMRGLFDPEIPPERSNRWMTRLMRYTATIGTELFSYIESLWETAEKDRKLQNDHTRKIRELERKVMTQGRALEDHDDLLCKMTATLEKQEKVMEVLTQKIMLLESHDDDNGERLNNHSYRLGCLELPQVARESGSNPLSLILIVPHLGCSCSVSSGVWDCSVFARVASSSTFIVSLLHQCGLSRELYGGRELQFQWSARKSQSLSRGSGSWSS
jgi:uncharacterized coiled-coil protein SlyX